MPTRPRRGLGGARVPGERRTRVPAHDSGYELTCFGAHRRFCEHDVKVRPRGVRQLLARHHTCEVEAGTPPPSQQQSRTLGRGIPPPSHSQRGAMGRQHVPRCMRPASSSSRMPRASKQGEPPSCAAHLTGMRGTCGRPRTGHQQGVKTVTVVLKRPSLVIIRGLAQCVNTFPEKD